MSLHEIHSSLRKVVQREKDHDGPLSIVGTMALLSAVAGVLLAAIFIPGTALLASTVNNLSNDIVNLPLELKDQPSAQTTRLLASNGDLIAYFYEENRQDIPLAKISPLMQNAILSIEDARFYDHGALDLKGTLRALVNNASQGQTQGGSSITQQLVKLTLVSQATTKKQRLAAIKKSTARKIRELKLAIEYEEDHTKKEILERYLNLAYFGDSAYGISAASYHYFSVSPAKLNVRQAATLAGLVKNPVEYDPGVYPEKALARRNTVLAVMARLGKITEADAKRHKAAPLGLKITKFPNGCVSTVAEFSCDYVRRYLLTQGALGATVEERQRALERGGLTIKANIDVRMQKAANKAVQDTVKAKDSGAIGAIAMVEPGTGKVRSLAQSRPMGGNKKKGQSFINFVVPRQYGDSGGFPAGSTFKMFTVAAALRQGIDVGQTFRSPARMIVPAGSYFACNGGGTAAWPVKNSTTSGTKNLYSATRESVNTYFAQLEKKAGLCNTVRAAEAMGITVPDRDHVGPFTLGVTDVSPLDVAASYATPASGGLYCKPRPIDTITDANGQVIKKYQPVCERAMNEEQAAQINDILRGVQEPGGYGYQNGTGLTVPSAGKTGTTEDNMAVWYAGYTPDVATAAMIAGVKKNGSPGSLVNATINGRFLDFDTVGGSSLAGPMWAKAMQALDEHLPGAPFDTPPARRSPVPADNPHRR
ncbi:transglycosylase domain-containing protein [Aeromicrobium sp.]|uniref:transglycosylase domain-containing protein n=1 Tax=Aeromicrobium sp. TaxID=1871063 RepID=UPI0030C3196E